MNYIVRFSHEGSVTLSCQCGWMHYALAASVDFAEIVDWRDAHEQRGHWETVGTSKVEVDGATLVTRVLRVPSPPVVVEHGRGVSVSATTPDGEPLGSWRTFEDGTHIVDGH